MATQKETALLVQKLVQPICDTVGVGLWDVTYLKEGGQWVRRITIEKEPGVDIEDCEKVSRALSDILDELDPIEQAYCLEVTSPGLNRTLRTPAHFERYLHSRVCLKTIRPIDGERVFIGELAGTDDTGVNIAFGEEVKNFSYASIAKVCACDDVDLL